MSAVFSAAQLRSSLWAREGVRVYAVIDGLVVPGLAAMLAGADVFGWDSLQRGALSAEAAEQAAYLVQLKPASPFTDWLIDEATPTYPGWGVLVVTDQPLLPVREHLRSLCEVTTPDGERRKWRWYDADVLRVILPALLASQLDEVFSLRQTMVIPAAGGWTWLSMEDGVLSSETRATMAAAR